MVRQSVSEVRYIHERKDGAWLTNWLDDERERGREGVVWAWGVGRQWETAMMNSVPDDTTALALPNIQSNNNKTLNSQPQQ
ncbi:hypothetical protein E2C01_018031 [Portunus trituberculatus]|uniref:Uncharacterized protein n=1 Tax=Portunus trituberculatus TaxID=210409 RepID=A0A5B7DV40_PORTR|nr:hypothetical protein [Portunus trituberculatus]